MKMHPNQPTPAQQDCLSELGSVGIQVYVGSYNKKTRILRITDWILNENIETSDFRKAAAWLLKRLSLGISELG